MKLVPRVGEQQVPAGTITVYAEPAVLQLTEGAVIASKKLTTVTAETLEVVVERSKALHRLLSEIEKSRAAAKRQFLDANTAIDDLAKKISAPVRAEYNRVTGLLAAWKDAEDRRKAEEERLRREAEEAAIAEARRIALEAERQRQELLKKQAEATTRRELEQASLDLSFHETVIPVAVTELDALEIPIAEVPRAPIPGGVTTTRYRFRLVDPVAAYQYDKHLVRWELSAQTANDIVRMLNDKKLKLEIPGVQVEAYTDVNTPSAR